ncbi:MAG: DUF1045 domain-containing protein [Pseudooceanicola atlanticus]
MTDDRRYAIYYAPEPGPLAEFGAAWLGWDLHAGRAVAHPDLPGLPRPVTEITDTPRKYGLHGTIKPPFRLAEGRTLDDLRDEALAFCTTLPMLEMEGLKLARLGGFLALVPEGHTAPLAATAARLVEGLDHFRAPAEETELARRRAKGLTDRQDALLLKWGYPYVMEEFRFHITLTGRLSKAEAAQTEAVLSERLDPLLPIPFVIRGLVLAQEDDLGRFRLIETLPFGA